MAGNVFKVILNCKRDIWERKMWWYTEDFPLHAKSKLVQSGHEVPCLKPHRGEKAYWQKQFFHYTEDYSHLEVEPEDP